MTDAPHIPVMLHEVVEALAPRAGATYVDGTFGAGGYTRALLAAADCRVVGIDRDPSALARGEALAAEAGGRLTLVAGCFGDMDMLLEARGIGPVDGISLDIGVSSMQLDEAERGFSFMRDGPLDMRMGGDGPTAADLVNTLPEDVLARLVAAYGEEPRARAVARAIVRARMNGSLARTLALANVVAEAGHRTPGIHPATRTFQALRIAVNDEIGELARGLAAAERILAPEGRLAVVSFHSLEDRVVKRFLTIREGKGTTVSRHLPERAPSPDASFRPLFRGAKAARAEEARANPRARSAKLRAAIRTSAPAIAVPPDAFAGPLAATFVAEMRS